MADYYSIIKKTISGLPNNTPEMRAIVYSKARTTIERQLRALQPEPSEEAITAQLASLEDAISTLDDEFSVPVESAPLDELVETMMPDVVPKEEPASEVEAAEPETPEVVTPLEPVPVEAEVANVIEETSEVTSVQVEPSVETPEAPETIVEEVAATLEAQDDILPEPEPVIEEVAEPVFDDTPQTLQEATSANPALTTNELTQEELAELASLASGTDVEPPVTDIDVSQEVTTTPVVNEEVVTSDQPVEDNKPVVAAGVAAATAASVKTTEGALDAMSSAFRDEPNGNPDTAELGAAPYAERYDEKPKSKLGSLVATVSILALLGGGAYAAWINKDALFGFVQSDNTTVVAEDNTQEAIGTDEEAAEKEAVRIGDDGEDISAGPVDEDATSGEETQIAVTPEEPVTEEPATPEPEVVAEPEPEPEPETTQEPETPVVEETTPVVEAQVPTQVIAPCGNRLISKPQPNDPNVVTEIGYLYEEGSAGSAPTRTSANVTWMVEDQKLEKDTVPEPVIIGNMEVPDKGLSLNVMIKRNLDEAVSASHFIELRFDWTEGFSGQGINDIGRFVMKATEAERGQALSAVPLKVSEKCFLLALENLPQALELNTQLLTRSSWVDVVIAYTQGTRGLLTLEKGESGDKIFKDVFADWQNR